MYIKNSELVFKLANDVKELQLILNNLFQLDAKSQERKELDTKLQKEQTDLDELKLVSASKQDFSYIVNQIKGLLDERNNITGDKPLLIQQKNNTEKDLKNKADRLKSLLNNEIKYIENFELLADVFNTIEANKKRIELSNNRSQSCVNYIISKGINPKMIIAKGYGETKLVNQCADGVICTIEEHQANRRTELRFLTPENELLNNEQLEKINNKKR
jgi:outer membrane protein OmpA-like peptidoglycan-associated protein